MNTLEKIGTLAVFWCLWCLQSCQQEDYQPSTEQIEEAQRNTEGQGNSTSEERQNAVPAPVDEKNIDSVPIVVPNLGSAVTAMPVALIPFGGGAGYHGNSRHNDQGDSEEPECPPDQLERENNVATVTDQSRSDQYNGFLRGVWVSHGTSVNMITRGLRGFFTADSFFEPPATVDIYLSLVGNFFHDNQDFVIMDCRPTIEQTELVQPFLATWPNTFAAIVEDLGGSNRDCASPTLTPGEKEICEIAIEYQDSLQTVYDVGLAETLAVGEQMFATTESTDALRRDYGIFPAFTGLGFTVQDSATSTGETAPMTTEQILRNSVVPEYLLKNVSLTAANCRCLQVPASASLHNELIDPGYIWSRGKLDQGACRMVDHLSQGET